MTPPRHPERSEGSVLLYPYTITPAASVPPQDLTGLRGAAVAPIAGGRVSAWVSSLPQFTPSKDDLASHHAVCLAAFAQGPCLPMRFGASFASEGELRSVLGRLQAALVAGLDRVAGKAELSVTLEWRDPPGSPAAAADPPPAAPDAGPGRRFLDEVRARQGAHEARRLRAEALARDLQSTFGLSSQEAVNRRICPSDRVALSCAVLIDAARGGAVMDEVRRAAAAWTDVRLHLAGPWPPYSFSALD